MLFLQCLKSSKTCFLQTGKEGGLFKESLKYLCIHHRNSFLLRPLSPHLEKVKKWKAWVTSFFRKYFGSKTNSKTATQTASKTAFQTVSKTVQLELRMAGHFRKYMVTTVFEVFKTAPKFASKTSSQIKIKQLLQKSLKRPTPMQ